MKLKIPVVVFSILAVGLVLALFVFVQPKQLLRPPPDINSSAPPDDKPVYPVWFGTNRKPNPLASGFTTELNNSNSYGRVDVFVPEAHRFGETGNPFWIRLLRLDLRDDHLRVQHVEQENRDQFYTEIKAAVQAAVDTGNQSQALVFIHGFNVTFEEAAIRAAQIGYDLKVPGPTAFFSWPSRGNTEDYTVDEATIEASEGAITDFLVEFASRCSATNVDIIAHSMGNRGLLRALQRISGNAETRSKVKFHEIIWVVFRRINQTAALNGGEIS